MITLVSLWGIAEAGGGAAVVERLAALGEGWRTDRRRIVKADTVMTGTAWAVVAAIVVAIGAGVLVVAELAEPPAEVVAEVVEVPVEAPPAVAEPREEGERDRWPLIGILIPAAILLFATWVTGGLYRHFTHHGHGGPAAGGG